MPPAQRSAALEMLRRTRLLSLRAVPALRRACSSSGAAVTALAGDRPSASQEPHVAAEAVRDLGSASYSRAADDNSALDDGTLAGINELLRKRLEALAAGRWSEAEALHLELKQTYPEVTVRHRAREWRADHGGLRLPPYKLFGAALEAEGGEVVAKVRQWAEAVEAKQPESARRIRADLAREGVQLFPWRYDAAAADLQPDDMPSAAELEQLTVKVESLLASRDECLLRDSPHAALLDRRAR